jgi:hypothetical protein
MAVEQLSTITWGHAINSIGMLNSAIEYQLDMIEVKVQRATPSSSHDLKRL